MTLIRNHLLIPILSLLAIACTDSDTIIHESSEKSESYRLIDNCDSFKVCLINENVLIWITEDVIKEEKPFNIYLKILNGEELNIQSAKIEGTKMNMGYIPLLFRLIENDIYLAEGIIGACVNEDMQWQMSVNLSIANSLHTFSVLIPNTKDF